MSKSEISIVVILIVELLCLGGGTFSSIKENNSMTIFLIIVATLLFLLLLSIIFPETVLLSLALSRNKAKLDELSFTLNNLKKGKNKIKDYNSYVVCKPTLIGLLNFGFNNRQVHKFTEAVLLQFSESGIYFQPSKEKDTYFIPKETVRKIEFYPLHNNLPNSRKLLWITSELLTGKVVFAGIITK